MAADAGQSTRKKLGGVTRKQKKWVKDMAADAGQSIWKVRDADTGKTGGCRGCGGWVIALAAAAAIVFTVNQVRDRVQNETTTAIRSTTTTTTPTPASTSHPFALSNAYTPTSRLAAPVVSTTTTATTSMPSTTSPYAAGYEPFRWRARPCREWNTPADRPHLIDMVQAAGAEYSWRERDRDEDGYPCVGQIGTDYQIPDRSDR